MLKRKNQISICTLICSLSEEREQLTKGNLCSGLSILLPDFVQQRLVNELSKMLGTGVDFVLVSERRIMGDMDALCLVPLDKFPLLQPGVEFHLVDRWHD